MRCSEPSSLVMRFRVCDYCRKPEYDSDANDAKCGTVSIIYNYGILSCKEHTSWAKRDCNAYLGRIGRIQMCDAEAVPAINRFLTALRERYGGFPVLRTNGDIDHGWKIKGPTFDRADHICRMPDLKWALMVETIDTSRNILKGVNISDYLRDDIICHFPDGFKKIVEDALTAFDTVNFYQDEMREWEMLSEEPDNGHIHDIPQIQEVLDKNGNIIRMLIPDDI